MQEFHSVNHVADDCRALALDVMKAFVRQPDKRDLGELAMVFLARAVTALESVQVLAGVGLNADATSVSRTIIELCFELSFITKEETEERFELFFGYEAVLDWMEEKATKRLRESLTKEGAREGMDVLEARYWEAKRRYREVKSHYPSEYDWCSSVPAFGSRRKRAVSVGGQHLYDLAYAEACSTSHAGPTGLRNAYSVAEDPQNIKITFLVGRRVPSGEPIKLACWGFIPLVGILINFCGLQAEFDDRHAELLTRLNELPLETASAPGHEPEIGAFASRHQPTP